MRVVLIFFVLIAPLFLSSCVKNKNFGAIEKALQTISPNDKPIPGDWVIIHTLSDPEGLNPFTVNDASSQEIFPKIFESMLELDPYTAELSPVLADSLPIISDDKKQYIFRLRTSIFFSDGKPVSTDDVVFSFKAIKNPLVIDAAAKRNYYNDIENVTVGEDKSIVFTMKKPYFLADNFIGTLQILPKHIFDPLNITDKYSFEETNDIALAEKNSALSEFANWFGKNELKREPKYLVGSGPYIFEEWRRNEQIRLKRNDNYWGKGIIASQNSYPSRLVWRPINDRTSAVNALKNADIDFMVIPPRMFVELLDTVSTPYLAKAQYDIPTYMYIGWNMQKPMFQDKRVRQALSHLVDKKELISTVMLGFAKSTIGPIYQGRPEYDTSIQDYEYNPAKAKKLLAEAGWSDTNGDGIVDKVINGTRQDLAFSFLLNSGNETRENLMLLLIEEMRKVGVKAEIQKLEWAVFLENLRSRQYDAYIGAWVNDNVPPDLFQIWHSSQAKNKGSNYVNFMNARVDELIEKNRIEFDAEKRKEFMIEIQQILHEERPYTFLWLQQYTAGYNKSLQNVRFSTIRPGYFVHHWWVPPSIRRYSDFQ